MVRFVKGITFLSSETRARDQCTQAAAQGHAADSVRLQDLGLKMMDEADASLRCMVCSWTILLQKLSGYLRN